MYRCLFINYTANIDYIKEYRWFINSHYQPDGVRITFGVLLPSLIAGYYDQLQTGIVLNKGMILFDSLLWTSDTFLKYCVPQLYWVLSENDFTLEINNPHHPKIVCVGNNPEKQQIYGAVLSLYISRLVRKVNKKGMHKCSLVFDEFPTILTSTTYSQKVPIKARIT